jgi:leucine dehydrogenase
MAAVWDQPDFDDHEMVHFITDRASGLCAVVALHSTHLGPGAGGTRFWHYADPASAVRDALRLSRGMSYKNAMAGLPVGGGKAVILADSARTKTPAMLAAFATAIDQLGGRYVTAQDVGMSEADMVTLSAQTQHVAGLPAKDPASAGGDPGPSTATGVYLGIKAAAKQRFGADSVSGLHIAVQGLGSVGGGVARQLAKDGAKLTVADVDSTRAAVLGEELGANVVPAETVLETTCDIFSPNALGAIFDEGGIARLNAQVVAGGANNQLATAAHGPLLAAKGVLYAPDYVINAGGIVAVTLEYLARVSGQSCSSAELAERLAQIPVRLASIWEESAASGRSPDQVADSMAQALIGR